MIKSYSALLTMALSLPLPVLAQSPVQAPISIASIPLDQLCRADGALDLRFGDRVDGAQKGSRSEPKLRKLDEAMLPFEQAELGYSRYSFRLWSVGYLGTFASTDDALAGAETLVEKAKALNWHLVTEPDEEEGLYQYSFSSKPEPTDPPAGDETTLSIVVEESTVSINCENTAQSLAQFDEAMGKMPVGMPKPQLADYEASISTFTAGDCDDSAKRAAFEADVDAGHQALLWPNWSRLTFEEDLANWKVMKLTSSNKTDFDTVSGKIIGLIDSAESADNLEIATEMLNDFTKGLDSLAPDDEAGMCRLVLKMAETSSAAAAPVAGATGDAVTPQWRATHELLDREAKQLGVSFDS